MRLHGFDFFKILLSSRALKNLRPELFTHRFFYRTQFEDHVFCNIENRKVNRKLTVAFSAEYGRPTSSDDMILVALMKKSRDAEFDSQRVYFTRYELLQILNWSENGQNYRRIDQALNRLIGTHLVWDNAFWDNEARSWVDRKFSIIDDAHLYDREKYDRARDRTGESRPKSWFKWSDVMYESFQAGYIKTLDLEMLNSLNEMVGKRLYRWLDKHFNNPKRKMPIEIPISDLATRKLGFKSVPPSHLIRMMQPAIKELESVGFVALDENRVSGRGKSCVIRFRPNNFKMRSSRTPTRIFEKTENSLEGMLIAKGIPKSKAKQLASEKPEIAKRQLEHLEFKCSGGWSPGKSEAAWLMSSIKHDYQLPKEFKTSSQLRLAKNRKQSASKQFAQKQKLRQRRQLKLQRESSSRVAGYLKTLSPSERSSIESRACEVGSNFLVQRMEDASNQGEEQIAAIYREQLLAELVDSILKNTDM